MLKYLSYINIFLGLIAFAVQSQAVLDRISNLSPVIFCWFTLNLLQRGYPLKTWHWAIGILGSLNAIYIFYVMASIYFYPPTDAIYVSIFSNLNIILSISTLLHFVLALLTNQQLSSKKIREEA